jgi:hypothetical protein
MRLIQQQQRPWLTLLSLLERIPNKLQLSASMAQLATCRPLVWQENPNQYPLVPTFVVRLSSLPILNRAATRRPSTNQG